MAVHSDYNNFNNSITVFLSSKYPYNPPIKAFANPY